MNPLLCNITLISLTAMHFSPSPIFSGFRSNLYFKNIIVDRSFSAFSYNNRYFELKKSKFSNFLDTIIKVDHDIIINSSFFPNELNLSGIGGIIKVDESLFYNISGRAIIRNHDEASSIYLMNSQFINISSKKSNVIELQKGSSLFVNSTCFCNMDRISCLLKIKVFLSNAVQINYTTICSVKTEKSLIDCTSCSFDVHNVNFTKNQQNDSLMVFNSMNYFSIVYLALINNITNRGFDFTDHIDLANFTYINVINEEGNNNTYIFYVPKGSIYVYHSSFSIYKSNLVYVNSSTALFFRCTSSGKYNYTSDARMIWSIACSQTVSPSYISKPNPDLFAQLQYCDGSPPNLNGIETITNLIKPKKENLQQKGATEILGILLLSILAVCIVGLSLWMILYFVAFKNPLREFDEDDQMAKWKQRWDWIMTNTNKGVIEHGDCSDMELDPIELSEDAIKRRQNFYNNTVQGQFSDSQNLISEGFDDPFKKKNINKKQKATDEFDDLNEIDNDELKSDNINNDDDSLKNNGKTVTFNKSVFNNHKKNNKETNDDDDSSKKKNESKKAKSLRIHFMSSDEDENKKEEDKSDGIISESDDLDADNDKIINDLKKTKNTWNRFQKTGIDQSLGTVDQSSDSSWGFKNKNLKLVINKPTDTSLDSSNIWSDDDDDKKKKKNKNKKGKHDDDYDDYGYGYDDDDDDDENSDDIWSDEGDDEGGGDDDKEISDIK